MIWQIKATLALGISALGTALTLAVMMGGMSVGSFLMGRKIRRGISTPALRAYGYLELIIGAAGLLLTSAFSLLERADTWIYSITPAGISIVHVLGIIAIIGIPTLCMGATLPIYALLAKRLNTSIVKLYCINTFGAAASVLAVAFLLIPWLGIKTSIILIASINLAVGGIAILLSKLKNDTALQIPNTESNQTCSPSDMLIVFVTGFAFFTLEIAWFRSFSNIFSNTTDVFAIMLACVLIALGLSAKKTPVLIQQKKSLGTQLCIAAILILALTPIIEHLDTGFIQAKQWETLLKKNIAIDFSTTVSSGFSGLINQDTLNLTGLGIFLYLLQGLVRFLIMYLLLVPPMRFLGTAFPWILSKQDSAYSIGRLNAVNAFAAIVGAIFAAWILLPTIGFVKTAWLAGALVMMAGIAITPGFKRVGWATLGIIGLSTAMYFESGIGKTRIQGFYGTDGEGKPAKILGFFEGPQATISAVEYSDKSRALVINSVSAATESGTDYHPSSHYMAWMGHLPMLLHPNPKNALVICLGTGQTANAVRSENPESLDIVDVNANVFKLAKHFRRNKNVILDPRVNTITMDGRAYMRRTTKNYDVITLEPMPPNAAGVNALYAKEFYELAYSRLTKDGVIAQWLPFHIVAPQYTASIVKTFIDVFPNAILWMDHEAKMGILIGSKNEHAHLSANWPGFTRTHITRDLNPQEIRDRVILDAKTLARYGSYGSIINDDNQLLSYGKALYFSSMPIRENYALLQKMNNKIGPLKIENNFK